MTARGPRSRGLLSAVAVAGLITGLCSACGSSSKSPSAAGTTGTTGAAGSAGSTSVASGVSGCPAAPGVTPTEVKVGVQSSQTGLEASYDCPSGLQRRRPSTWRTKVAGSMAKKCSGDL